MESLRVNGVERQFASDRVPATLAALVSDLNLDAAALVAEVDGTIVPSGQFADTQIAPGQCIELIKFMGGG
jgi:thiamine biosynthesis protein ThiS